MFDINNQEIGNFISMLIEKQYESARKFCIAYLKTTSKEEPTEDSIQNMANRLSQIKNGKKAIQIYDLPIFSELLDVSFEQILSAGKCGIAKNSRMTNYTIAQSHNKEEWISYINRTDNPILNLDEYELTVLDYAIKFSNYDFLKFLIDKGYIWFDSGKNKDYCMTFGAGTRIRRIRFEPNDSFFILSPQTNNLEYKLATEDQFRMHIISLAIDHNDLKMLKKLKARKTPELYFRAMYSIYRDPDLNIHYDKAIINHIAKSSNKVLAYFTSPFQIEIYQYNNKHKYTFIFPYISQLLDILIENNNFFVKTAVEKAIEHNKITRENLISLIKNSINIGSYYGDGWRNDIMFSETENGNFISFRDHYTAAKILTNIATVTKKSKDTEINLLINKLNNLYNSIQNIKNGELSSKN